MKRLKRQMLDEAMRAWKADRREIAARLCSSGFRRAFTNRERHPSVIEADGCARWEADRYLPSLESYELLLKKASFLGKMFYIERGDENSPGVLSSGTECF